MSEKCHYKQSRKRQMWQIKQHIFSKNQKVNLGKIEWFTKKSRLFLPKDTKLLVSFYQVKHGLNKEYDFFLQKASWGRVITLVSLGRDIKIYISHKVVWVQDGFFVVGRWGDCFLSLLFWFGFFNPLRFLYQFGNTYRKDSVKWRFSD